jgi:hypothetical protein
MIEAILNIVLLGVIALSTVLAGFFLVVAAVRHSKTMLRIGLVIIVLPVAICGVMYWYYHFHIPGLNKDIESEYVGTYILHEKDGDLPKGGNKVTLQLNRDNTFYLAKNTFSSFSGFGLWRSGATDDGRFEFEYQKKSARFYASPLNGNQLVIDLDFTNRTAVTFVKQ